MSSKANPSIPKFSAEKPYDRYKAELKAWVKATDVDPKKHGLMIALSLPDEDATQIRDKVFSEIETDTLEGDNGYKALIEYLDKQFGKDDLTETYERYVSFDECKREKGQKINDFILEYEKKYNALVKKKATYPEIILAMKLIDSCNLSDVEKKIVLSGMDYSQPTQLFTQSKTSLRKFIGEQAAGGSGSSSVHHEPAIKVETLSVEHEDALVAAGWQRPNFNDRGRYRSNTLPSVSGSGNNRFRREQSAFHKKSNPVGKDGNLL